MLRSSPSVVFLFTLACSQSFDLPAPPPPPGAGSISGRLIVAEPGTSRTSPAVGASVQLLRSNVNAVANAEGRFVLAPITAAAGAILIQYDANHDGAFERQRILQLADIGAGPGRDVSLGDLLLRENATLRGKVLLGDLLTQRTGHAGTTVFIPEGPFTTYTGDDGGWLLLNVPEGAVTVAFFHEGYAPGSLDSVAIRAGEAVTFRDVVLTPTPGAAPQGILAGQVLFSPALGDASGANVLASSIGGEASLSVSADGSFRQSVPVGLYTVAFSHGGYEPVAVPNVLVWVDSEARIPPVTLALSQPALPAVDAGPPVELNPPVARIGSPLVGRTGSLFQLDATGSTGPAGHPLTFQWLQTEGAQVDLTPSAHSAQPRFVAPLAAQSLRFEVIVSDVVTGLTGSAAASVAFDDPPAAAIDVAALVPARSVVTLDAAGSAAPGGHTLSYSWRQSAGDTVLLSGNDSTDAVAVTFAAPAREQILVFALTVKDQTTQLTGTASALVEIAEPPVARIGSPGAAALSRLFRLDAGLSTAPAGRALTYRWDQTLGEPVTLSVNDSVLAATPTFVAPATAQRLRFELTVTDVSTGLADTEVGDVEVVAPPVALIRPTGLAVRPGNAFLLDGRGSYDPRGALITHRWSLVSGDAETLSDPTASQLRLQAGVTEGPLVAQLVVSNGLLASEPALVTVQVSNSAQVVPTVSAGPDRTALYEQTVALQATAASPTGEPLTYLWTQTGGAPTVSLIHANSDLAYFLAPAQTAVLRFRITVTAGLQAASDDVTIEIVDRSPPRIVDSEPAPGLSGSWLYASATFDEALDPSSVSTSTVFLTDASSAVIPAAVTWDPPTRMVKVLPDGPLAGLSDHVFHILSVRDTATPPNVHSGTHIAYSVRAPQWRTWTSDAETGGPPLPSVAATSREVIVAAMRKSEACMGDGLGGSWILVPDTGTSLVTQSVCDPGNIGSYVTKSAFVINGDIVAAVRGSQDGMPRVIKRVGGNWVRLPRNLPDRTLFTDGVTLYSGRVQGSGPAIWSVNLSDGSSTLAGTLGISSANDTTFFFGAAQGPNAVVAVNRLWNSGGGGSLGFWPLQLWIRERSAGVWNNLAHPGTWLNEMHGVAAVSGSTLINQVYEPRITYVRGAPFVIWSDKVTNQAVNAAWYVRGSSLWNKYLGVNNKGASFSYGTFNMDVAGQRSTAWLAYVTGGSLFLRRMNVVAASPAFEDIAGPDGAAQNVGPTCAAYHPELAATDEALYLTWQESCVAGEYRVYLRKLD